MNFTNTCLSQIVELEASKKREIYFKSMTLFKILQFQKSILKNKIELIPNNKKNARIYISISINQGVKLI